MFKNLFSKNKVKDVETKNNLVENEETVNEVDNNIDIDKAIEESNGIETENNLVENEETINSVDDNLDVDKTVDENVTEYNTTEQNQSEKDYQISLGEFNKLLFESPNFNSTPFTDDMNNNEYSKYLKVTNFVEQVAKKDLNLAVELLEVMKESIRVGTLSDALNEGKKLLASRLEEKNKNI